MTDPTPQCFGALAAAAPAIATVSADQFETDIKQVCGAFQIEPVRGQSAMRGGLGVHSASGIDIARVAQDAWQIDRTKRDTRRDPGDNFFLIVQEAGTATMGHEGRMHRMDPGDMLMVDSAMPSVFHYGGTLSSQLSLHLPREEQTRRFGNRIAGGIHIPHHDALGQAMRAVLHSLLETRHHAPHVAEAFYSVMGAYLMNRSMGTKTMADPRHTLMHSAVEVMHQHYADPDFCVSDIARHLNVSMRHLQRAFQGMGDTLRGRLLDIRLGAARRAMAGVQPCEMRSIAQVAFECGFADLSTFHRQFKARFDVTPGAHLQECRRMP